MKRIEDDTKFTIEIDFLKKKKRNIECQRKSSFLPFKCFLANTFEKFLPSSQPFFFSPLSLSLCKRKLFGKKHSKHFRNDHDATAQFCFPPCLKKEKKKIEVVSVSRNNGIHTKEILNKKKKKKKKRLNFLNLFLILDL